MVVFLFLSHYKYMKKRHNFFIFFILFLSFFIFPHSIFRFSFGGLIFNDGLNVSIFLFSVFLLFKYSSLWVYLAISFFSVVAILHHEAYIAFFVPLLFIIGKHKKASMTKLAIFSVPILVTGVLLLLYGRVEQFFTLQDFQNFAISKGLDKDIVTINTTHYNYYPAMPFYATMKDNFVFTKTKFVNSYMKSFQFYVLVTYFMDSFFY